MLHVITTDAVLERPGFVDAARSVLDALAPLGSRGVLHLRSRQLHGRRYVALVRRVLEARSSGTATPAAGSTSGSTGSGALVAVNARVDVALAAGADAVQLGRGALQPADVRLLERRARCGGAALRVGVSVHAGDPIPDAGVADWLLFGHVFASASHPDSPAAGLGALSGVVARAGTTPVVAIGGIGPGRVAAVLGAGAAGVAVVSGIWSEGDPKCNVLSYLSVYAERGGTDGRASDSQRLGAFGS